MSMFNSEHLMEKWAPLLDADGAGAIKDACSGKCSSRFVR